MRPWKEGEEIQGAREGPFVNVEDGVLAAAWADLRTRLETEGWRFRDVDVRCNAQKFGCRMTDRYNVKLACEDIVFGENGFQLAFKKTVQDLRDGIVLIRRAPHVVETLQDPADRSYVRARFGWAHDEADLERLLHQDAVFEEWAKTHPPEVKP